MRKNRSSRSRAWRVDRQLTLTLLLALFALLAVIGRWPPVVALNVGILRAFQEAFPFGSVDFATLALVFGSSQISLPILAAIGLLFFRQGDRLSALSLGLVLVGVGIEISLKATLGHPMIWSEFSHGAGLYPFPEVKALGLGSLASPFPSGHMLRATFLALTICSALESRLAESAARGLRIVVWAGLGVIAFDLLYLGWHWPTDILGGLSLGYILAAISGRAFEMDRRRWGGVGYRLTREAGRGAGRD